MVRYLFCDKCGGYYVLKDEESPNELSDKCECGGKLIYGEMKENTSLRVKFVDFWKNLNNFRKGIIVFIMILILLLSYASLNGFFEPKNHYNGKGVSFDYPSKYVLGYSPTINNANDLESLSNVVTGGFDEKDNSWFVVYKYSPSVSKNDMINFISTVATANNFTIISQNDLNIDNNKGYEMIYSHNTHKKVPSLKSVFFTKNNADYLIVFSSSDLGTKQSDINMIINSFHVT